MAKNYRSGRLGEEIKKIISNMLLRELKDPRLQNSLVSISDVEVSYDGSYATVYISVMGESISDDAGEEEKQEILKALKSASGFMRKEIGRNVKLRHVPELTFKIDNSLEYGRRMSKIIDSLDIPKDDAAEEDTEVE